MDSLDTKIDKYLEKYDVNNHDQTSPEYFRGAVKIALNEYNLPVSEIANEFQVADSTVSLWASGTAIPHSNMRQMILHYIAEKIEFLIQKN